MKNISDLQNGGMYSGTISEEEIINRSFYELSQLLKKIVIIDGKNGGSSKRKRKNKRKKYVNTRVSFNLVEIKVN